jgi:hypothetical protein
MRLRAAFIEKARQIAEGEQEYIVGLPEKGNLMVRELLDQYDGSSFFKSRGHRVIALCLMAAITGSRR